VVASVAALRVRGVVFTESDAVPVGPRGALTASQLGGVSFELVRHPPE